MDVLIGRPLEESGMDDAGFWIIIDECHVASGGDMDWKDQLIKAAIIRLARDEALAFYHIFNWMIDTVRSFYPRLFRKLEAR
jgi:hypothetical protein